MHGPAPSSSSRRCTPKRATTLARPVLQRANSTATVTPTCSSSQPRQPSSPSAPQAARQCRILSAVASLIRATARMLASPSMVARAGRTSSSPTTRSTSMARWPSRWAHTSSPARPAGRRSGSSTPLATSAAPMENRASSSTTLQCLSLPASPLPHRSTRNASVRRLKMLPTSNRALGPTSSGPGPSCSPGGAKVSEQFETTFPLQVAVLCLSMGWDIFGQHCVLTNVVWCLAVEAVSVVSGAHR
mmetsp:Transcript_13077/g.28168  ORF Transcript_13077/g.28168 Transcript_13077/m.28168 type:complete len:245 (+) Transcript_13077:84-818(+)